MNKNTNVYETHFHTSEVSGCGRVTAADGVRAYVDAGYSGILVTDHIFSGYIRDRFSGETWKEKMDYYLRGYKAAKAAAPDGFAVMLGMELRFETNNNDYLVIGIDEDFLYENEWFTSMNIEDFHNLCLEKDFLLIQAHPFRVGMTMTNPKFIDGVEVFNGNRRHDSSNDFAKKWAQKHLLPMTSGSDFHQLEDKARGGIFTEETLETSKDLRKVILSGKYEIKEH